MPHKDPAAAKAYRERTREARLARSREWWAANANDPERRERRREYMREYNEANKDALAEKRRADCDARRERDRLYRLNNPDKVRESKRRWRLANREEVEAYNREWRESNPDKVREQRKRYYWSRRDEHLAKQAARRAAGYHRERRLANLEKALASERASRRRHRAKRNERARRYHHLNYERFAVRKRTREIQRSLAKSLSVRIDDVPPSLIEAKLAHVRTLRFIKKGALDIGQ